MTNFTNWSNRRLRDEAKWLGLPGYFCMSRRELIAALREEMP